MLSFVVIALVIGHTGGVVEGIRARARAELLSEVSRIARRHLAADGAPSLSVRAIARELGMASSALYRYYPSRDALLTQLIIESYDDLGDAVEAAETAIDRTRVADRYRTVWHTVRNWARHHPHEYALIYGSPVPGYAAPDDTIDPATRVTRIFSHIAADADPTQLALRSPTPLPPGLTGQLEAMSDWSGRTIDPDVLVLGVGLWAQLFGLVSFELFGTFTNSLDDADEFFDTQIELGLVALGLSDR